MNKFPFIPSDPSAAYFALNRYAFHHNNGTKIGSRKVLLDIELTMQWRQDQIEQLFKYAGFSKAKLPRLRKTYVPAGAVELCARRLRKRLASSKRQAISVGFNFGTGAKDSVEQTGDCLSGIGFYLMPWRGPTRYQTEVHVFARSSEITRRMPADWMLVDEIMRDVLGKHYPPMRVRYTIGSAYVHAMHWMLWARMWPGAWEDNPDAEYVNREQRCRRCKGDIKYGPFKRACEAYLRNKKAKLPPLFFVRGGTVSLHDGTGKPESQVDAGGRSTGQAGGRSGEAVPGKGGRAARRRARRARRKAKRGVDR